MRERRAVIVCDISGDAEPSLAFIGTLARLRLTVRRLGYDLRVRGADARLRELLVLTGLGDVIPVEDGSAPEAHRQAEQREQPIDVEEIGDGADPAG
jgi:anti-anti-sigma regulatory factor